MCIIQEPPWKFHYTTNWPIKSFLTVRHPPIPCKFTYTNKIKGPQQMIEAQNWTNTSVHEQCVLQKDPLNLSNTELIGTATTFYTIGCFKYKISHSNTGPLEFNHWIIFLPRAHDDLLSQNKWPHQMIYVYNIFTTNYKLLVIISYNLNLPLK